MVFIAGAAVVAGGAIASSVASPSVPATPDYASAATAQGQANLQAAQLSTQVDRPNEITPYGSRIWYSGAQNPNLSNTSWTPYPGGTNPNTGAGQVGTSMYGFGSGTGYAGGSGNTGGSQGGQIRPSSPGYGGQGAAPNRMQANAQSGSGASTYGAGSTYGVGGSGSGARYNGASNDGYGVQGGNYGAGTGYGSQGSGQNGYANTSSNYDPNNDWTSVESLSPVQQQLFDTQNSISQSEGNVAMGTLGAVQQSFSSPASSVLNGLPSLQSGVNGGNIQNSYGQGGNVQSSIDTSNVPAVPSNTSQMNQDAYNALIARQNTQLGQQETQLQTQLANQGIAPGTEAYNLAMQPIEQSRVDASNQATINAGQLQQQQFDMASQANQQQFGENQAAGQFANQAQAQAYGQQAQNATFANSAQAQAFSQGLQNNTFNNQARAQGLQENQLVRELPANELNALRSGAQVQAPQFQAYNNSQTVTPTPVLQAAQLQGAANQQTYQNQVGAFNNTMQGVYGLGGALINY